LSLRDDFKKILTFASPQTADTMKRSLLLLLLLPFSLFAQVTDDFADGDFTQNPVWTGTTELFKVNGNQQLQLNAEGEAIAWLSLPFSEYETMEWRFWIKETFAPSGNNYSDVWLCSDLADLTQATHGYFLRFGEAGSNDAITLFRKDAEGEQQICRCREGAIAASFSVALRVVCDRNGHWMILTCYDNSGMYVVEAEGDDDTYGRNGYFGLFSKFTSSNAKKVYFDDVYIGSFLVDDDPPALLSYKAVDPTHLKLGFSEALLETTALEPARYSVDHGIGYPLSVSFGANQGTIILEYERDFVVDIEYQLTVSCLQDQWGNTMDFDITVTFRLPDVADEGDIVINEILFNPIAPGVDYVELYNNSNKTFDLGDLLLGVIKESFPNPPDTTLKEIGTDSYLFHPRTYVLLSADSEIVGRQYDCPTDNFVQMASFPGYINAGGTAILTNKEGVVIDQMYYSEDMHYPLLKVTKGVALERISFDQPSMDANNWHSAAERVHFGTPGQPNSMMQSMASSNDEILVSPDIFSPDGDGIDDACFISYRFDEAGYTMNIYIFNVAGQLIRHLAKGELVGQEGSVIWNGSDNNGNKVPVGVYVVVTEVFNFNGTVKQFKNAVVVGTR